MAGWSEFYAAVVAAAAALMGLLFVAVSINAVESVGEAQESSRHLAEQALQNYLTVLVVSLLALFPDMTLHTLGAVTLGVTAVSVAVLVFRLARAAMRAAGGTNRTESLRRLGASFLAFGMLLYAAQRMSVGDDDHRDLFASALVVLLASGTMMAWELLLRVARAKKAEQAGDSEP
jgi:hypothetical protein